MARHTASSEARWKPAPANSPSGIIKQIVLGLLASALFSLAFVLNRAMSLEGGHWVWTATLRYFDMAIVLAAWLALTRGCHYLWVVTNILLKRPIFWIGAGSVGCGIFYACICFAAVHSPGWIVAATWQVTILATPLVLRGFGARVPFRGVAFASLIFVGVTLIDVQRILSGVSFDQILEGALPVVVAAFAYPIGNQLLNCERHAETADAAVLSNPAAAVFLLTLGSIPFFIALIVVTGPPAPTSGQMIDTAIVAIVAGCIATSVFIFARNQSSDPYRLAAVDATQAGEVAFALVGEMLFLSAPAPGLLSGLGLAAILAGLIGFAFQPPAATA